MKFDELKLIEPLKRAVLAEGYTHATPIQARAIPHVLEGRDLLGVAQTGTGKTAAFALPILQRMAASGKPPRHGGPIRVLVLSPTRELAAQIGESFGTYGKHVGYSHAVIFGGVGQDAQTKALRRGVDILVATPGRLLDLMQQGFVKLGGLEVFVLDEADRMLDMGFIHDVRKVIAVLPKERQTLLFSATMPADIQDLAGRILRDPVRIEVTPVATTAEKIDQYLYFVEKSDKRALLEHLLQDPKITRALVFTRTKHGANRVVDQLDKSGIRAQAIHGNKSQSARERALAHFKSGETRLLVATDIAARGIDVEDISHVINYDLPNVPEQYVHRIGRTARAGASGIALSFCDTEEREYLRDIERLIRMQIQVVTDHPRRSPLPPPKPGDPVVRAARPPENGNGRGQRPGQRPGGHNHNRPRQSRWRGGPRTR
jgi:ATP-dependent RNA helicase RhlE